MIWVNLGNNQQLDGEMFSQLSVKSGWSPLHPGNFVKNAPSGQIYNFTTKHFGRANLRQGWSLPHMSKSMQTKLSVQIPDLENIRFRFVLALRAIVAMLFTNLGKLS